MTPKPDWKEQTLDWYTPPGTCSCAVCGMRLLPLDAESCPLCEQKLISAIEQAWEKNR